MFLVFFTKAQPGNLETPISMEEKSETFTKYRIRSIHVFGNTRTKLELVKRELEFSIEDSLNLQEWEQVKKRSEFNLINTSLFNSVEINCRITDSISTFDVEITLKERWYFWPRPLFQIQDRNFNAWWENRDFYRANYGMYLNVNNIWGGSESIRLVARKGYTELLGASLFLPYLNKSQTLGLSAGFKYQTNREIAFSTNQNKLLFYRNYAEQVRKEWSAFLGLSFRTKKYSRQFLDLSWNKNQISDSVAGLNPEYFLKSRNSLEYFGLKYTYRYDVRDSKVFPRTGSFVEFTLEKSGLNFLVQENIDEMGLSLHAKKYISLANRFFLSTAVKLRHRFNPQPNYFLNRALGFQDYIKGYEYYVIDGQSFVFSKFNIAYPLVKPSLYKIKTSRFKKFSEIPYSLYLSAHTDIGMVKENYFYSENPLSNTWLWGSGLSLTFISYYDYVFRLDFSVNKFNEKGIFLHFNSPI